MNKKISIVFTLFFALILFGLNFTSAVTVLDKRTEPVKQGDVYIIEERCDNSTYANISNIKIASSNLIGQVAMVEISNDYYQYNYTTVEQGLHTVTKYCDENGELTSSKTDFEVTSSGKSGGATVVIFLFIIVIVYGITGVGFFGRNIPITILGGMAMVGLGVYLINEGMLIYRDWITIYFAHITWALGAIVAMWALVEQLELT